jgi:drug/metabolite transporter (DMT)-like permease
LLFTAEALLRNDAKHAEKRRFCISSVPSAHAFDIFTPCEYTSPNDEGGSTMFLRVFLTLLLAICLTVAGELLLKAGMNRVGVFSFQWEVLWRTFTNGYVLGGFLLIFSGSIFWLSVISRWELSVAYPMLGLSYVITVVASWLFLSEQLTWQKLIGSIIISAGVFLVTRG